MSWLTFDPWGDLEIFQGRFSQRSLTFAARVLSKQDEIVALFVCRSGDSLRKRKTDGNAPRSMDFIMSIAEEKICLICNISALKIHFDIFE